jgi:hypothetical protein
LQGTYGIRIDNTVFDLRKRPSRFGKESHPPKRKVKKRASHLGFNAGLSRISPEVSPSGC